MPAANHAERIGARKITRSRNLGNRFLPRVDQVRVLFALKRKRADAEHPVFRMHHDLHALRNIVGDKGWRADAKIYVVAVTQFLSNSTGDEFSLAFF